VKTILDEQQVRDGVERMARQIHDTYGDEPLTIIGVMTGSLVLLADLIRLLTMPLRVGVVQARSYRGASTTPGKLTLNTDLLPDVAGRNVLLVDDVFDTGQTLLALVKHFEDLDPASVRSAVLLRKHGRQSVHMNVDFVAFEIPDEFVVGYGLDYLDEYRNLPYIGALEPADLAEEKRS
jgi:hypoxanthine phosphoribosyltransferase